MTLKINASAVSSPRRPLWILFAAMDNPKLAAIIPTLAWFAESRDVLFETYLEAPRSGELFATTGSTVIGGMHHQQFNLLCAKYDVSCIILGEAELFASSLTYLGLKVIAKAKGAVELYRKLGITLDKLTLLPVDSPAQGKPDLRAYYYQEIFFSREVGIPVSEKEYITATDIKSIGLCNADNLELNRKFAGLKICDEVTDNSDYLSVTGMLARRYRSKALGVAFGDPAIITYMMATLCREHRVAVYAPTQELCPSAIEVSGYTEKYSPAVDVISELVNDIGNPVIVGRQTGDGDLFELSRHGIAIQIADPNRPAFPVFSLNPMCWHRTKKSAWDEEPNDDQLEHWAEQGKILAALAVHSGEMAHNEAMLNLIDLCQATGLKLGIGTHVARLKTCPQLWELIAISRKKGGARGLIEPMLHCGGMGILTENTCPAEALRHHIASARECFSSICGENWIPRGYLSFMDSDMKTFTDYLPDHYAEIASAGMEYTVSCAHPGRNRIIWKSDNHLVINQTSRTICTGSPYVRISSCDDLEYKTPWVSPGWYLGVIDAPVIAFLPYIWRHGNDFMKIVNYMKNSGAVINVLPHTVARYAALLSKKGFMNTTTK